MLLILTIVILIKIAVKNGIELKIEGRSFTYLAFNSVVSAVGLQYSLHDGKSETRTADFVRVTLIYTIKSLENSVLFFFRYSDAVILDRDKTSFLGFRATYCYVSAGTIVLYCIIRKVVNYFPEDSSIPADKRLV